MMGRLRSTMQTPGATAALICALSVAGLSASHAAPPNVPGTDNASREPCNDVCKAYMAWSDRVSTMLHPSQPVVQTAVRDAKPAGQMVHHHASKTRQPGLSSFAQFPVRSDAAAPSAEPAQPEVAPSRAADGIADRFPAAAGFVTAILAATGSPPNDAAESAVDSANDVVPATRGPGTIDNTAGGLNIRLALPLLILSFSMLVFWRWFRGRARTASR